LGDAARITQLLPVDPSAYDVRELWAHKYKKKKERKSRPHKPEGPLPYAKIYHNTYEAHEKVEKCSGGRKKVRLNW